MFSPRIALCFALASINSSALAGDVEITAVEAFKEEDGHYRFSVTLKHDDTGWEHYANEWRVLAQDGTVLGVRELLHPHVNEQPFTRSLGSVKVPKATEFVLIDARDNVHGRSAKPWKIALPE